MFTDLLRTRNREIFTANIIVKQLESKGVHSRACSFMWNSVFQLDVSCHKSSIHNLLGGNQNTISSNFLQTLCDRRWPKIEEVCLKIGKCKVIILDEVSVTNTTLFVAMDMILRQAFNENKPFAGLSIILVGDFCQLPPNDGQYLAVVLASFQGYGNSIFTQENPESIIALETAQLFSNFKRVVLTEQMIAADDPVRCATIEPFSLCNKKITNYKQNTKRFAASYPRTSQERF